MRRTVTYALGTQDEYDMGSVQRNHSLVGVEKGGETLTHFLIGLQYDRAKTEVSNMLWRIQKMNLDVLMLDREEGKGA